MQTGVGQPDMSQKILLYCGILAPLVFLGTDWLAGRLLKNYSFARQSISELSAAGSPTRPLVVSLTLIASVLLIAFGVGVWRAGGTTLLPRVVSALVIVNAASGLVAAGFFPNRFGERPLFASAGVLLMFLSVVSFVLAMVLGAVAFGGWLRILSIGIPVSYLLLGFLRFATASAASAGESVSLVGVQERTMSYSFLLWVMALAIYLLLLSSKAVEGTNGAGG
jgi:hypothetical protein